MPEFFYPVFIPSLDKSLYFYEFTNKQYKTFAKILLNEDIDVINIFIDTLIEELCKEDINVKLLTVIDKLYIMFTFRANNVGPTLEFNIDLEDSDDNFKFNVELLPLLEKLEQYKLQAHIEFNDQGISGTASYPKRFFKQPDMYDIVYDCIDTVRFGERDIDLSRFTFEQRKAILQEIPSSFVPVLLKSLRDYDVNISKEPFVDVKTDRDLSFDKQMYISLFNNSMYEMLRMIYTVNLRDFYTYEYTLIKKFKFSYDHISSMTPAELHVYFNVISEDIEREKKEQEKSNETTQFGAPSPPNNMPHE